MRYGDEGQEYSYERHMKIRPGHRNAAEEYDQRVGDNSPQAFEFQLEYKIELQREVADKMR